MVKITLAALGLAAAATAAPQGQPTSHPTPAPAPQDSRSSHFYTPSDVHVYADEDARSWSEGAVTEYPIHDSCNATETALLRKGLYEAEVLAAHARDHIHRWGNGSSYFKKYFGSAGTAEPIGWYDKIVNTDKAGVMFRCDDIDGNCQFDGWAGHWRGDNATDETVICEMSYTTRYPLEAMCAYGYEVAAYPYTQYFASDLHHRLFHTTKIGEGKVGHYADNYDEVLQLAIDNPENSVRDSEALAFFALEVYAYDIAVPGEGCTGKYTPEEEQEEDTDSSSSSSSSTSETSTSSASESATTMMTTTSATAEEQSGSATTSSEENCHTHADGVEHCV